MGRICKSRNPKYKAQEIIQVKSFGNLDYGAAVGGGKMDGFGKYFRVGPQSLVLD
jgi:hypothetical protein